MSRTALLLAAALALAAPAVAAHAQSEAPAAPSATGPSLDIAVNEGQLVRLSKPVNSVFIADPAIADVQVKSPSIIYVIGKSAGTTSLYAVANNDEVVLNAQVHVRFDASRVEQAIRELLPQSTVQVNTIGDSLVLSGTVYSATDGDDINRIASRYVASPQQIIDKMQVDAPQQVNLRVRVAEVSRDIVKQFGINWENVFDNSHFTFGIATGTAALTAASTLTDISPGALGTGLYAQPTTSSATTQLNTSSAFGAGYNILQPGESGSGTVNNLFGGVKGGNYSLNSVIDALDDHGLVTLLAEPNLTAISGQPASFLAGGEFPVPVPAGNGVVGIDWKDYGVSLDFVATVLSDDRISLHVAPEVSELSNQGSIIIDSISVPSLTTRRAETTVELGSGQSFVIGGLLQNNITQNINKFPWLGDVPILGQLFRSEAFQRGEDELLIIVTPYLVHPIESASRALAPTDGYVASTDAQLIMNANEYQQHPPLAPAAAAPSGATQLIGPVGFDLQ